MKNLNLNVILYRPHLDLTKCNWKKLKRVNRYNSIQYRPHLDLRKCKWKRKIIKKKSICKYITLIVFGLIINRFTYD